MDKHISLSPCPFCGEPVVFNKFAEKVVCEDCGATIYSDYWNTRPIEDALQTRIAALSTRIAEFEAENKWLKAKYERLKAIAEEAGLIIDNANDEFRRELQSIKLQQKRGPDLDEWGRPKNEVEK